MKDLTRYSFDFRSPGKIEWVTQGGSEISELPESLATFLINDDAIGRSFSQVLDPILADAIDIAISAHMADRLAMRRRRVKAQLVETHRELSLKMPVRNVHIWSDPGTIELLRETLSFLTQDTWHFEFVPRGPSRYSESQGHLFESFAESDVEVGLFSGGLDSFAGNAIDFERREGAHFVCVSGAPTNIQRAHQRRQFRSLCEAFGRHGTHVAIQYAMLGSGRLVQEPTRRTRGFVFLTLGLVTAISAGSNSLNVYENGVGAINLPYDLSQIGIDNTRAMHPRTLRNVAALLSRVSGKSLSIKNRSMFVTKAQMCSFPAVRRVSESIRETFSCDGMTHTGDHCGYCTSCLLRRQALQTSHLTSEDHKSYINDILRDDWKPNRKQSRGLFAMTWQAHRLRSTINQSGAWPKLVAEFPELQSVAAELSFQDPTFRNQQLVELYRQFVDEWFAFAALKHVAVAGAA